jgi:hypothetical protein
MPKLRTGEPVTVIAETVIVIDPAKDAADAILTGEIVPEIGVAAIVAAEVEAEIAGARTEAAMSALAAAMTAMSDAVAAAAPRSYHLPHPAAALALLRSDVSQSASLTSPLFDTLRINNPAQSIS